MKPMKILLVGNYLEGPGFNRSIWHDIANQLERAGYEIIRTSKFANPFRRLVDMLITIWARRQEYDVAQMDVFSGNAFIWAELSARMLALLNKPFVITLHGGNLPKFYRNNRRRVSWLLKEASAVTTPSCFLLGAFQEIRKDIQLIPNSLAIHLYPFIQRENPNPNLIWLRAFHKIYQPELAPKVLDALLQQFPQATLVMAGPDKEDGSRQITEKTATELGVSEKIEFTGRVEKSEVPNTLNRGDIFINTTTIDNTPVSVMEAMACGLCIVSTNVGGIPYLLENGVDSLLVQPGNPEAMAQAVRRILTEPGLAARLSSNARKKAEQFDWKNILPQWEHLFQKLSVNA